MTVDEVILNYLVFSFFIYLYVYKFIFGFPNEKHIYFLSVAYLANPYSVGEKNEFFPTRQKLEFEKEHYMCPFVMYVNIESGRIECNMCTSYQAFVFLLFVCTKY